MQLIKPSNISGEIMTLLEEADEKVIIVSPYCRISKWYKFLNKVKDLWNRNINIEFYVRAGELETIREVKNLGIVPIEVPYLHCKLYLNEKYGIVSSMNLLLSSEINGLEIAHKTEENREYQDLVGFYERYLLQEEVSQMVGDNWLDHIGELVSDTLDSRVQVSLEDGSLWVKTNRNRYEAFIVNEKKNLLRITGILSQKEYKLATSRLEELNSLEHLKIELQAGDAGYYDLIWGVGVRNLQSSSFSKITKDEQKEIAASIISFVVIVDQFKQDCY